MTTMNPDVAAGQAIYTRRTLALYDLVVLGISNRLVWRCPTARLVDLYNTHVTGNHLEVGPGTGFFLDRCRFPAPPRLAMVDLNRDCLDASARRLARYRPATHCRNILEPLELPDAPFDSIGINYVLHCLPGSMEAKSVVFDQLRDVLGPGGVVFGSTLLHHGVERGMLARRLMRFYNRRGVFSNTGDDLETLGEALASRFAAHRIQTIGCAALFWGRAAPRSFAASARD